MFLASCVQTPPDGYANAGDPERQIMMNTHITTIMLSDRESVVRLKETLKIDPPLRAQLFCPETSTMCIDARKALIHSTIPLEISNTPPENSEEIGASNVALIYESLATRPCDNKYRDNSLNSNNIAMPQLGCSMRSNTANMVSDKQQFVNPALLDYFDGDRAAKNYQNYVNPPAQATPNAQSDTQSLVGAASSP